MCTATRTLRSSPRRPSTRPRTRSPRNGTLRIDATGRVDCNNVKGDQVPAPGTVLGDTLVVSGGSGGAEVWVEFYVRPGPGTNLANFNTWYNSHTNGITRMGPWGVEQWKVARMDTAEVGGVVATGGTWMTAYHESEANFTGHRRRIRILPSSPSHIPALWPTRSSRTTCLPPGLA